MGSPPPRLILASASPRRRMLLAQLGLPFEVIPSGVDEALAPQTDAASAASTLALRKARDVAGRVGLAPGPAPIVLGADTVVVLDDRLLGKPASRADGRAILRALSDRAHAVVTGVAVVEAPGGRHATAAVTSRVIMRAYSDAEIEAYLATGEGDDKAGAYALQAAGGGLVRRVEGSVTNVIGLPLETTARLLRRFGLPARVPPAVTVGARPDPTEPAQP